MTTPSTCHYSIASFQDVVTLSFGAGWLHTYVTDHKSRDQPLNVVDSIFYKSFLDFLLKLPFLFHTLFFLVVQEMCMNKKKRTLSTKYCWLGWCRVSIQLHFPPFHLHLLFSPSHSLRLLPGRGERGLNLSLLVCKAAFLYRLPPLTTPWGTGLK